MSIMQNMDLMGTMTQQVIATDFLLSSKTSIRNCALALSEAASPEVRDVLRRQLDDAISTHERISNYMMNKGYYHAYNPQEQIRVDMQSVETVMGLQSQTQR